MNDYSEMIVIGNGDAAWGLLCPRKSLPLFRVEWDHGDTWKRQQNEGREAVVGVVIDRGMIHVVLGPRWIGEATQLPHRQLRIRTVHEPRANCNCIKCYT